MSTTVIVHGRRNREKTERVAANIIEQGGWAYAVAGDLTQDDAVERLVIEAEELAGAVDILVTMPEALAAQKRAGRIPSQPHGRLPMIVMFWRRPG